MIRTRSGPMIPVEFFDKFILTGDERYIQLACKLCKSDFTDFEWWGELDLTKVLNEAGNHKCPKVVSPAEDTSMTNAKTTKMENAAVEIPLYGKMQHSQSKGNPYANIEKNGGALMMTVNPKNNVL